MNELRDLRVLRGSRVRGLFVVAGIVALAVPLLCAAPSQTLGPLDALGQEVRRPPAPTGPSPRLPDGTIDLNGLWIGGGPVVSIAAGLEKGETLPLLPSAKALMADRAKRETDDPHLWCMPMGVPRTTPYPFRFVQNYTHRSPTHLFILFEATIHTYRQVFMDGRTHPDALDPTWFGHSIGRFEKDTLVIDTVGFNDKFWFDRQGTPHTEQLHTVERWTRKDLESFVKRWERMPREAQAAGAVPICTKLAALGETVAEGVFIEPHNVETRYEREFLAAVKDLLVDNPGKRIALARQGRRLALDNLGWEGVARQWVEHFGKVIADKESRK
jgi:hypothetical protein